MDWPIDDSKSVSTLVSNVMIEDMIERNRLEYLSSTSTSQNLEWDNDSTLVSIQARSTSPEDDILDETLETNITIQELGERVAAHELNVTSDDDPNSSQHSVAPNLSSSDKDSLSAELLDIQESSSSSDENFEDLYVPDLSLLNTEPHIPPEDSVSSRLRSRSTCSDRSNEDFNRHSRLRRPQRRTQSNENVFHDAEESDAASRDQL